MPELPEAEVVARQLRAKLLDAAISDYWIGRDDIIREGRDTVAWYRHATITAIERRGKSVILSCTHHRGTRFIVAELGMTGLLLFRPPTRLAQHTHMILSFSGSGERTLHYWNPRRFGRLYLLDCAGLDRFTSRRFGCDPLTVSAEAFHRLVKGRRGGLKALLMHQQAIAGIGNIYANEILYRAGLHPHRMAGTLSTSRVERLYRVMQAVLAEAIKEGGSSVRDFVAPDGTEGRYRRCHLVYNKAGEPCVQCRKTIRRLQGERSSFYCPACQRA